ncbi:MAG: MmgE/PrpD family protein [Propionibacteriales bacterium]|nr:MmgE/PrpD family protein [Propionibacteriales bacterium]
MSDEPTLADRLAAFAVAAREKDLPDEVAASVRSRILDVLGICVAAATLDTSRAVRRLAAAQGGNQEATAIGVLPMLPATQAAFVNGVLAHSLDYDDTHLPSVLHPSASVVPAALAVAERAGSTGRDLVAAVAAGLEVTVRVGMAGYDRECGNSLFFENGQHATSICGALGSAVAAAVLLGADARGVRDALAISASMGSGILEANRTGGTVKRLHCGWAAQSGVTAALLAREGWTGPPTVLEGRFGFFQAWLHGPGIEAEIVEGLGETWSVPGIFFKPYPANHFTHAAVDAAAALRRRGLRPADVASAVLAVPHANVRTIGEPLEVKQRPETGYMAQFSGPYAVAAGLHGGSGLEVGLDDYTDELACDDERRALMARVTVVGSAECDAVFPRQLPAVLTVTAHDGSEWEEKVMTTRGGPDRPLTPEELQVKFGDNVEGLVGESVAAALSRSVGRIDELIDVRGLLEATREVDAFDH